MMVELASVKSMSTGQPATPTEGTARRASDIFLREEDEDESKFPRGVKLFVIMLALCLGTFIMALDTTIIGRSLPANFFLFLLPSSFTLLSSPFFFFFSSPPLRLCKVNNCGASSNGSAKDYRAIQLPGGRWMVRLLIPPHSHGIPTDIWQGVQTL